MDERHVQHSCIASVCTMRSRKYPRISAGIPTGMQTVSFPNNDMFDRTIQARIAPAQDALGRDVMIKLTRRDSLEHRIYKDLLHCSGLSGEDFSCVLPPVAILDTPHDFSFVVMPR